MDYDKIFRGTNQDLVLAAIRNVCAALTGKGLSTRQAEAILELAKDSLKDEKI